MRIRRKKGQSIAELPVAIFFFVIALMLPMVNLATIALGATNVFAAARNAAHYAGRSDTFAAIVDVAKSSAIKSNQMALGGVDIQNRDISVEIVGTPLLAGKPPIRQARRLDVVDAKAYLYQIEVRVTGRVTPLMTFSKELFGSVPGLTEPMTITSSCREYCERPKGLSKS